jgi:hypothetical protein
MNVAHPPGTFGTAASSRDVPVKRLVRGEKD